MDDTIYRQAAKDVIANMQAVGYSPYATIGRLDALLALNKLPSAEKQGKWIVRGNDSFDEYECSECGCVQYFKKGWKRFNYCPTCGAKMKGRRRRNE